MILLIVKVKVLMNKLDGENNYCKRKTESTDVKQRSGKWNPG